MELEQRFLQALRDMGLSDKDMESVASDPVEAFMVVDLIHDDVTRIVSFGDKSLLFHKRPLYVTEHALKRLVIRWSPRTAAPTTLKEQMVAIETMLKHARMETLSETVRRGRLIRNGGRHVQYWRSGKWRLVMRSEDGTRVLLTVERPYDTD